MRTQIRYQKEIEKLESQNRELRKQLMLRGNMTLKQQRKIKKSLIDMYSEVLDQLSGMFFFELLSLLYAVCFLFKVALISTDTFTLVPFSKTICQIIIVNFFTNLELKPNEQITSKAC